MSEPKPIGQILRELAQDPTDTLGKILSQIPCIKQGIADQEAEATQNLQNARLENWIDGQDVMQALHISPRTLQTLRSNGTVPYTRIGHKLYYLKADIERILKSNYVMCKLRERYGKDL